MPREPQTTEQYIEHVTAQAKEQEGENVQTHQQILEDYESTRQEYQHKTQLFSFLLVALMIAYIAVNYWEDIKQTLGVESL